MILTTPVPNSISTYSSSTTGIGLFTIGSHTCLPFKYVYLSSFGLTATAVSPSIVSGRVVANSRNSVLLGFPFSSTSGYLICQKCPACSSYSTSASEIEVLHTGHQLMILLPLYIHPFSCILQNTSVTALLQPSSMVKRSLSQSQEEPIFLSWLMIRPPYSSFHSQARFKKPSRPRSSLSIPSSFSFSMILTSVAMEA